MHDTILAYAGGDDPVFNRQHIPHDESYIRSHYSHIDESGRRFCLDNITSPHFRPNLTYVWKGLDPPQFGWRYDRETMEKLDAEGRIHYPNNGGRPRLKRYLDEMPGIPLQDIWDDVSPVNSQANEATGYPTQKPSELLQRIILGSSNAGDMVLDCFSGTGTTAAVAQKFGRRWIGCDVNKGAIQTAAKRLRRIIEGQIQEARQCAASEKQGKLIDTADADSPKPAQFGFNIWRVNDYDLAIQHNEAVNLACQHIGVEHSRSDRYFDGMLGKALVKVTPFGHPLTPIDLEELKRELEARPDEERPIVVVCLGIELSAKAWVEEWNRLRKGSNAVNKIEVIELRTDPKYGRFLRHEPADARVKFSRKKGKLVVEITDFVSPAIVERLRDQAGLLAPKIDDWRAMVDYVAIDPAYDGGIFNAALVDVPEKKSEFVEGRYELPAPDGETAVAVKITDMLGEEVLKIQTI